MKNPKWTRDELILAMDLYFKVPRSAISASNLEVVALSEILNRLRSVEPEDVEKFRNPNGVGMKLHNFGSLDKTLLGGGLSHGGKLDSAIWNEFCDKRALLSQEAQAIRERLVR